MNKKYKLFSYGTFQEPEIQKIVFGKIKRGTKATLKKYGKYSDETPYLCIKEDDTREVEGTIINVTLEELFTCEQWESVPMYKKYNMKVIDSNGKEVDVIVYNKEPIGKSKKYMESKATTKKEDRNKFLNEVKQFAKDVNQNTHNLKFGDLISMFSFSINQPLEKIFENKYKLDVAFMKDFNDVMKETFEDELIPSFKYDDFAKYCLNIKVEHEGALHNAKFTFKNFNSSNPNYGFAYLQFLNLTVNVDTLCRDIFINKSKIKIETKDGWTSLMTLKEFFRKNEIKSLDMPKFFIYSYEKLSEDLMKNISVSQSGKKVVEKELEKRINEDLANYGTAQIFATQQAIFEIPKEYNPYYKKRMLNQFLTIFIYELLLYKKSLNVELILKFQEFWKLHNKMPDNSYALEKSLTQIKEIYRNNKEVSSFVSSDLFIYPSAKRLQEKLFPILGIQNIIETAGRIDEQLIKIESESRLKKQREDQVRNAKKMRLIKFFALLISLTSSSGLMLAFLIDVLHMGKMTATLTIFLIVAIILLLISIFMVIDIKRRKDQRRKEILEYETLSEID
ncbi:gamma-glutamylcyclotransferase family protein [Mycoplasma todarodis]|uniref:gamma-glutamylcyclotransferase family protein n=1 Tax=Mycoplasma todarodis TaxID=1937191 RepID=UPI003B29D7D9